MLCTSSKPKEEVKIWVNRSNMVKFSQTWVKLGQQHRKPKKVDTRCMIMQEVPTLLRTREHRLPSLSLCHKMTNAKQEILARVGLYYIMFMPEIWGSKCLVTTLVER